MQLAELQQQQEPRSQGMEAFYMSFGDLMVILCCFFVLIHSISKVDVGSFERIRTELTGQREGSLVALAENLQEIAIGLKEVQVSYDTDGVRINMETAALFELGSAVLKTNALAPLEAVLQEVKATAYAMDIEGHTDDLRFYRKSNGLVESNWSLSGLRASTVAHHLLDLGFPPSRLRIVGYAANRPLQVVVGKSGEELQKARAVNRRVSILVH